jgi:xylulokinase
LGGRGGPGDNASSAVGIGAVRPGEGFISLGTSGVVFLCNEAYRPHPESALHTFCHALPDTWHQMSVMLSAASALRWARELLGLASESELLERVALLDHSERARAPLFLPYLSGERTPHNDPAARAAFIGLSADHSAAELGYAVIEGVAFGLLDGWHAFGSERSQTRSLILVGGGAQSAQWAQLIASVLEMLLVRVHGSETSGALGAARLTWLATGGTRDDVCRVPAVRDSFEPETAQKEMLMDRYGRFGRISAAVRSDRLR